LERFLFLSTEDNMQVVCPSTPAQYFHCLRRQVKRNWRKPLVVLTPKSLLRHPRVVSSLEDLATGRFRRILGDTRDDQSTTSCVLLASGKMYYDLAEARAAEGRHDVSIVRIDQFYPLPDEALREALQIYPSEIPIRWVQEEPENMGAWPYWKNRFCNRLVGRYPFSAVVRPASASPATGSAAAHRREQEDLISRAFEPLS
jgi:2-oxoglutarate dehydrogenase E1 component